MLGPENERGESEDISLLAEKWSKVERCWVLSCFGMACKEASFKLQVHV